jgi:hypothetical protein
LDWENRTWLRKTQSDVVGRAQTGARSQPFGYAVNEQISDLVFAQVPLGKGLVILPSPFPKL